ncbi:hypothetical protein LTR62_008362 [Meristemomyces frigidus]|uniref:EKC/KEOPS complex subunit GON7 n=1 Tax=Meristemomyces frigidus TaxID=1508187 RepID=A0AAN7TB49_9PEZI|nr:hypothetical protein LTR62_008362 [Meristemomyces frigidus]
MAASNMTAVYISQDHKQEFSAELLQLSNARPDQNMYKKTEYLSTLRSGISQLQVGINSFLTERIGTDKIAPGVMKGEIREEQEEENYGERNFKADA